MKHVLFVAIAMTMTSTAFATHAYRSENCKSSTLSLAYRGNYPVGGDYGISLIGDTSQNAEMTAYTLDDEDKESDEIKNSDIVFAEVSSVTVGDSKKSSDCNFDHEEWNSNKVMRFDVVSAAAAAKFGLKQGDVVKFTCEESTDYPNGNSSDGKDCKD